MLMITNYCIETNNPEQIEWCFKNLLIKYRKNKEIYDLNIEEIKKLINIYIIYSINNIKYNKKNISNYKNDDKFKLIIKYE